jgi:lipopolysaccharide export LptBFGC system permease protein LptF
MRKIHKRSSRTTTTKQIVWAVIIYVFFVTQESVVLSLLKRDPLSTIVVCWITTGIGTIAGYLVKAYLEKKNLPPLPDVCITPPESEKGESSV